MTCDRCGSESGYSTGSYFDTAQICLDCAERERAHPKFDYARKIETQQCKQGNFNYPGIGLPPELRGN